jgi:hypothetical protein
MVKVAIALAIAVPVCIVLFAVAAGIVGTILALAFVALKIALIGAVAYAGFRLVRRIVGGRRKTQVFPVQQLPIVDPYYQAAMRELDAEMGTAPGR